MVVSQGKQIPGSHLHLWQPLFLLHLGGKGGFGQHNITLMRANWKEIMVKVMVGGGH